MSFGVVQSMIASLKSNRNLLDKRSKLKGTLSGKKVVNLNLKVQKQPQNSSKKLKKGFS